MPSLKGRRHIELRRQSSQEQDFFIFPGQHIEQTLNVMEMSAPEMTKTCYPAFTLSYLCASIHAFVFFDLFFRKPVLLAYGYVFPAFPASFVELIVHLGGSPVSSCVCVFEQVGERECLHRKWRLSLSPICSRRSFLSEICPSRCPPGVRARFSRFSRRFLWAYCSLR